VNIQPEHIQALFKALKDEVGKVVVGSAEVVDNIFTCFFSGGHILLEGVPGLGKTMTVKTLAQALDLSFNRIQFTPDIMPADIIGTMMVVKSRTTGEREFRFQKGPLFSNVILADEINRATPKTQSAMLEAMAEGTVTVGGHTYPLEQPFIVLATQNPMEMEGTYPLPEAQLDRFFFKVIVEYPTREELNSIVDRNVTNKVISVEKRATSELVKKVKNAIKDIPIAQHVKDFASKLILATQPTSKYAPLVTKKYVSYGASPRGLLAIVHGAKARALLNGRLNASIDDIKAIALPALRHRIIVNFEAEAEGITSDKVIADILKFADNL
jgi:MoxR-like ATPase